MKQEATNKKNKLWIWLVVGAVVLAAILGVGAFMLFGQSEEPAPEGPTGGRAEIYWNVDRIAYTAESATGLSTREPGADGLFHIKFAIDGEHVEYTCADKKLVNRIDMMDAVCLVFGEDGSIVDVVDPATVATLGANKLYIMDINDQLIKINSSAALNGMVTEFAISDVTKIYDVSPDAAFCGEEFTPDIMDQVIIYQNDLGETTHVFVMKRVTESAIYWRMDRFYDSANAVTLREPGEDGIYTIPFSVEGKQVDLKCKDKDVVTAIDKKADTGCFFGFKFDAEGYIVEVVDPGMSIRGVVECNQYDVTAVDGNNFTLTRILTGSSAGTVYSNVITENTGVYNYTCTAEVFGEATELQVGDRVYCLVNARGEVRYLLIMNRMVDSPLYWNISRNYNSTTKETTREPVNGWYVFDLAANGGPITVRTRDKAIASKMDSYGLRLFGLKLDGDVVVAVYDAVCVTGNYSWGSALYVTNITGPVVSATSYISGTNANGVMSADCKVYDVSGLATKKGEVTELRVWDRIYGYKNAQGEICVIFVYQRLLEGYTPYWNLERKYSTTTKETTRKKGDNGFYVFDVMSFDGKITQIKTSSKDIATEMDKKYAPMFAVRTSGGEVVAVKDAWHTIEGGTRYPNYYYVDAINDDGTIACWTKNSTTGKVTNITPTLAEGCVAYNVSDNYVDYRGERTSVRVGDRIVGIRDEANKILYIFVTQRESDSPLYFHNERNTSREADENGWYHYELWCNGELKTFKTNDPEIAKKVDSFSVPFGMRTDGDIILRAFSTAYTKLGYGTTASMYDIMSISANGRTAWARRNRPAQSDTGKEVQITFASNCKVYDCTTYSETFGQEVKLQLGDRVHCITNVDGQVVYVAVMNRNTREAGHVSVCPHCDKEVFWEPFSGSFVSKADGAHYYMVGSLDKSNLAFGSDDYDASIVLDLNGMVWHSKARGLMVSRNEELTIIDTSKAQTGAIICDGLLDADATEAEIKKGSNGGAIMVYQGGKLNIYAGTYSHSGVNNLYVGGGAYITGEGSELNLYGGKITDVTTTGSGPVYVGSGGTFNMYGGELTGLTANSRGAVYLATDGGTMRLLGGKIYGNTGVTANNVAAYAGELVIGGDVEIAGDVAALGETKVTLEGKPVITKGEKFGLNLGAGVLVDTSKLETGASISISAAGIFTEKFATAAEAEAAAKHFVADDEGLKIYVRDNALCYGTGDLRCINGHKPGDAAHEDCGEEFLDWRPWSDPTSVPTNSGNYYLTTSVTLEDNVSYSISGNSIILDLQGHEIVRHITAETAAMDKPNFRVYQLSSGGKLTVTDTSEKADGRIYTVLDEDAADIVNNTVSDTSDDVHKGKRFGSVIYVNGAGAELVLLDGFIGDANLKFKTVGANNGTITVGSEATATIKGGLVIGMYNTGSGSAIGGWGGSTINIEGGFVQGTRANAGGAIATTGTLNISGGNIVAGKAGSSRQGSECLWIEGDAVVNITGGGIQGGVYIFKAASVTVSGDPIIEKSGEAKTSSFVSNVPVDFSGLTEGAKVYVTADSVFSTAMDKAVAEAIAQKLVLSETAFPVSVNDRGELYIDSPTKSMCMLGHTNHEGIECEHEIMVWNAWGDDKSLPTEGNFFLMGDVNVTTSYATGDLNLDLNGYNITRTEADGSACRIYAVGAGKTFNLTDTAEEDGVISAVMAADSEGVTSYGALIYTNNGADDEPKTTFNMYGGIIDASQMVYNGGTAAGGAVVANSKAVVNIYGGEIHGYQSSIGNGSAIGGWGGSVINIHGGSVWGGTANKGATISTTGYLTIDGGFIVPGEAATNGDSIYFNAGTTGALVIGGNADIRGGVYIYSGSVKLEGTPTIDKTVFSSSYSLKTMVPVDVSGLKAGAKVYVTASDVFTTEMDKTRAQKLVTGQCVISETQAVIQVTENGALEAYVPKLQYCVYGHTSHEGIQCDAEILEWNEWTETDNLPESGNYYLTGDVVITATVKPVDLVLDLAGYNVTRNLLVGATGDCNVFTVEVDGTFTLTDTNADKEGVLSVTWEAGAEAVNATKLGKVGKIGANGIFKMYGGILDGSNISGNTASATSGTLNVENGTAGNDAKFFMYGGKIIGYDNTGKVGSAIISRNGTTVAIYGGEIVGGKCKAGSAIYPGTGPVIVGGNAKIDGGVYVSGNATRYVLEGTPVITNLNIGSTSTGAVDATGLEAGAAIDVNNSRSDKTLAFATVDEDLTAAFSSKNAGYEVVYNASANTMAMKEETQATEPSTEATEPSTEPSEPVVDPTAKTYCAFGHETHEGIECTEELITWIAWDKADSLPVSGNYYLTQDVTVSAVCKPSDLALDLKGFDVTRELKADASGEKTVFAVATGKTFILTDTAAEDGVVSIAFEAGAETVNATQLGKVAKILSNATMKMYGGILDGSNISGNTNTNANGTLTVENGSGDDAKFYMYGGKIIGMDNTGKNGSAIANRKGTLVALYGGEVVGGNAKTGGAVFLGNGPMIIGGDVKISGGSVYVGGDVSRVTLEGKPNVEKFIVGSTSTGAVDATGVEIGAAIGISNARSDKTTAFATVDEDISAAFSSTNAGYEVVYNASENTLAMQEEAQVTEPSTEATEPSTEATEPSTEATEPSTEATEPSTEATEPSTEPSEPVVDPTAKTYCAFGHETHEGIECDAELITWTAWTETDNLPEEGNIYLTADVLIQASEQPTNLNLDLNGFNVTRQLNAGDTDNCNVFFSANGGYLLITDTDEQKEGVLSVTYAAGGEMVNLAKLGKVVRMGQNSVMKLYGGIIDGSNITGNTNSNSNATVTVENGTLGNDAKFYMYGGKIIGITNVKTDGTTYGNGSALISRNGTTIEIYGGEIVGGTCKNGAAIHLGNGVAKIMGGRIIAGTAKTAGGSIFVGTTDLTIGGDAYVDGGVYINGNAASLTLEGAPQIPGEGRYTYGIMFGSSASGKIDATGLTSGAKIKFKNNTSDNALAFATVDEDLSACFESANTGYEVAYDAQNNALYMKEEAQVTEPSTEATQPSTEATQPSTEATEPSTEATEPSTEATQPSTEATEPSTEATEPSTEATEPSTEATEPSTEATEPSTEPAPVAKTYCVWGHESHEGIECTEELLTWEPWTETTTLPKNGTYYLTDDVVVTTAYTTNGLTLDLAGYDITREATGKDSGRIFGITAEYTLTITDTAENDGTIKVTMGEGVEYMTLWGPVIYTAKPSTLNLYGGIIDGSGVVYKHTSKTTANATVTINNDATFNMYGGTVIGLRCGTDLNYQGSAIASWSGSTVNITGGKIVGGETGRGAAICVGGTLNLSGAEILPGVANTYGETVYVNNANAVATFKDVTIPGGVYIGSAASVTISGNTVIAAPSGAVGVDLYADVAKVTPNITALGDNAKIVLTGTGALATADQAAQYVADGKIVSAMHQNVITVEGNTISVAAPTGEVKYCVYGHTTHEGVECAEELLVWTAWDKADSLPTEAGNYYLTDNVVTTANYKLNGIVLDLNGFDVTRNLKTGDTGDCNVFSVAVEGNFTLTDTDPNGEGVLSVTWEAGAEAVNAAKLGKVGKIYANGIFKMYGGVLDGSNISGNTASATSGTLNVENGTAGNDAKFFMYGGKIIGIDNTGKTGSAIISRNGTTVAIYGGEIVGGKAKAGSAIYPGTGPVIVGGNAKITGAVYVSGDATRYVLEGAPELTNLNIGSTSTGAVNATGLEAGASIAVNNSRSDKTLAFATVDEDLTAVFSSKNSGFVVTYDAAAAAMAMVAVPAMN